MAARDADGDTCLTAAVRGCRRLSVVTALLEAGGTDIDARNNADSTALHLATRCVAFGYREQVETVATLLAHGADPTIPDASGRTPLEEIMTDIRVARAWPDTKHTLVEVARMLATATAWWRRRHMLLAVRGRGAAGGAADASGKRHRGTCAGTA